MVSIFRSLSLLNPKLLSFVESLESNQAYHLQSSFCHRFLAGSQYHLQLISFVSLSFQAFSPLSVPILFASILRLLGKATLDFPEDECFQPHHAFFPSEVVVHSSEMLLVFWLQSLKIGEISKYLWVTHVCPRRQAVLTAWNESVGGSLFCSFSRRPTVCLSEEVDMFRLVSFAICCVCYIPCGISLSTQPHLTNSMKFFNPGQKIFWLALFLSLKYVAFLL